MKQLKLFFVFVIFAFVGVSCSDDNDQNPVSSVGEQKTISNLHAPVTSDYSTGAPVYSGDFVKFSFSEGKVVTTDNWDVAFRGTTILVNGGTQVNITDEPKRKGKGALAIVKNTFGEVTKVTSEMPFKQDAEGELALPKSTWYSYNGKTHVISPVAGTILVIKTHDGHYAKMEITSYYKDGKIPTSMDELMSNARYYNFNYVYNSVEGDENLQ